MMAQQNTPVNRFALELTDAAFTSSLAAVQAVLGALHRTDDLVYVLDTELTTPLHELLRRIVEHFCISDPKRYTYDLVDRLKKYFKIAKLLRDHVTTEHERRCPVPLAHIILKDRSAWTLTDKVATNLLQSIATTANLNYLLYTRDDLVELLCYELASRAVTPATVNAQDRDGNTALHLAVRHRQWKLVRFLVSLGADRDLLDEYGFSIVNQLSFPRRPHPAGYEMLELLVTPATRDRPGLIGNTLLHRTTFVASYDQIRLLLDRGANINLMNDKKLIALDLAIKDPEDGQLRAKIFPLDIIQRLIPDNNVTIFDIIGKILDSNRRREFRAVLESLLKKIDPNKQITMTYNLHDSSDGVHVLAEVLVHDTCARKFPPADRRNISKMSRSFGLHAAKLFSEVIMKCCCNFRAFPCPEFRLFSSVSTREEQKYFEHIDRMWREFRSEYVSLKRMSFMCVLSSVWRNKQNATLLPLPPVIMKTLVNYDRDLLNIICS